MAVRDTEQDMPTNAASQERPFMQHGIVQLEGLVEMAWSEHVVLAQALFELERRTTSRAIALRHKVATRLRELVGDDQPSVPPQKPADGAESQPSSSTPMRTSKGSAPSGTRLRERELEEECERLRSENSQLQAALHQEKSGDDYALVGLAPSCPNFLVEAAEKAFRRAWHPDMLIDLAPAEKARKAQTLEAVLAALARIRAARLESGNG